MNYVSFIALIVIAVALPGPLCAGGQWSGSSDAPAIGTDQSRHSSVMPTEREPLLTGTPAPLQTQSDVVTRLWAGLGESSNACPDEFDYFPGGGMRIFACHLFSIVPYAEASHLAGPDVFLSGPHSTTALVLDHRSAFGHYNPEWVRWLVDNAVPGEHDAVRRAATQPIYDEYVRPLAHMFYVTYQKSRREPECFAREVESYRQLLERESLPERYYERFFFYMNPQFCEYAEDELDYLFGHGFDGGYDGNVVKTTIAFWIRRTLDGTATEFYRGLEKLLQTYDEGVFAPSEVGI